MTIPPERASILGEYYLPHERTTRRAARPRTVGAAPVRIRIVRSARRADVVIASLVSRRLDGRLLGGAAPEPTALTKVRCAQLVSAAQRRKVVRRWERLAQRARRDGRWEMAMHLDKCVAALAVDRPIRAHTVALARRSAGTVVHAMYDHPAVGVEVAAAAARAFWADDEPRASVPAIRAGEARVRVGEAAPAARAPRVTGSAVLQTPAASV